MSSTAVVIRSARRARSLSQRQLGLLAEVDHTLISRIEHGYMPTPGVLARLARVLHLNLSVDL